MSIFCLNNSQNPDDWTGEIRVTHFCGLLARNERDNYRNENKASYVNMSVGNK